MTVQIIIEDHVVPQLFTSAIEAYEFEHKTHTRGKGKTKLETYGLLWGYVLPERNGQANRVVATLATIETSALRHEDWVAPDLESLRMKRDFFQQYWPNLELVGTFHSHPYENLPTVQELKGWRASDGDHEHWPHIHQELAPELPHMAHLIVTITGLERRGRAAPKELDNGEAGTGFVLSSDYRKFWIKGYATEAVIDEDTEEADYSFNTLDDIQLDIPSLVKRFQ